MKKLWVPALAVFSLALVCVPARAGGGCGWACPPVYDGCSAGAVQWVEQVVTCYRTEMRERAVPVTVQRPVWHEVVTPYTTTVRVPEYHNERRVATVYTSVPREVVRNVTLCRTVPITSMVKRWVTTYNRVPRQVTYNVTSCRMVPVTTNVQRMVTTYQRVPRQVTYNVTCCQLVPVTCVDPCTGCSHTVCRPQYSTQAVTATVWECVPATHAVTVPVTTYQAQPYTQPVTTTVWECVPATQEVTVPVTTYQAQYYTQAVRSVVWECVPVQKEYWVPVCSYRPEQRTYQVRRMVCQITTETVLRREWYCQTVPYQTTVKVPVPAAPSPGWGGCCY
jgi:hypothetical protein